VVLREGTMDFKAHLQTAWEMSWKFLVPLVVNTLVMVVVGVASLGILAPVTAAGYTQSLLLALRQGREPKVGDLFSEMRLFLPLLGFSIAAALALLIGFWIFFIPGTLVAVALVFCCLYLLPLLTDQRMGILEALRESFSMGMENVSEHIVVAAIFVVISALGSSVMLGVLLTQPFATLFLLSVYEEKMRAKRISSTPRA
jgi:hypothetical protein